MEAVTTARIIELFRSLNSGRNWCIAPDQPKNTDFSVNKILIINDAVGSGATLNEIEKIFEVKEKVKNLTIVGDPITGT